MRATTWTRWATCALVISIAAPAAVADRGHGQKSLADCTSFEQVDKGDDGAELTIHNTCSVPVDCSISWQVVCAPDSPKRRTRHSGSSKLTLTTGDAQSAQASTAVCHDDSWSLQSIQWSCAVNKN